MTGKEHDSQWLIIIFVSKILHLDWPQKDLLIKKTIN